MVIFALLSNAAQAVVYIGSPSLSFRVDRTQGDYLDGLVDFEGVRLHKCGGGYTDVAVGAIVDLVAGVSVAIPAGDY